MQTNHNTSTRTGFLNLAIAISLGALGAHALNNTIEANALAAFKTGVLYHLIMSVLITSISLSKFGSLEKTIKTVRLLWLGTYLFSGSLYVLSTYTLVPSLFWLKILGPVTPIGGLLMIISCARLAFIVPKNHP